MSRTRLVRATLTLIFAVLAAFFGAQPVRAQTDEPASEVWRARMTDVVSVAASAAEEGDLQRFQTIDAELLSGPKKGETVIVADDHLNLRPGDTFFLNRVVDLDGVESYQALEIDRLNVMLLFAALFALVILLFGGRQGLRSLLSLAGSFFVIVYVFLPQLLKGAPPVLTSILVSSVILLLALYSTHGFRRTTHAAFLGTMLTIVGTGALAALAVKAAALTGFASEEAAFLNSAVEGRIDIRGLLLGGIIIGILGILDDIAVTQAVVVEELRQAGPELSGAEIYKKALRVGKEHVGALVNTLALAYAGSSLPLLLLFSNDRMPALAALNGELVATEVIRTIIGSIGLIMAVPITTLLAVLMLSGKTRQ